MYHNNINQAENNTTRKQQNTSKKQQTQQKSFISTNKYSWTSSIIPILGPGQGQIQGGGAIAGIAPPPKSLKKILFAIFYYLVAVLPDKFYLIIIAPVERRTAVWILSLDTIFSWSARWHFSVPQLWSPTITVVIVGVCEYGMLTIQ